MEPGINFFYRPIIKIKSINKKPLKKFSEKESTLFAQKNLNVIQFDEERALYIPE